MGSPTAETGGVPLLPESAVDVPQLDPFEEAEEKQFSLRLHRGASFTSMASSSAEAVSHLWVLSHHIFCVCVCVQAVEKKVPQAISFSKQHSQSEATPTSPSPFTRLTPDSSRSSGRSSDSSALSGMVGSEATLPLPSPATLQVLSRPVTLRQLGATIREPGYLEGEFKVHLKPHPHSQ